jgi:DNA-binding NarL/FixJ family response regulator
MAEPARADAGDRTDAETVDGGDRDSAPALIRVVIADDQALVRGGLRVMVDAAADMTVVAEARDGAEALAQTRRHHPDVVLMDVRMPIMDGIEATRAIAQDPELAQVSVLVLTTFDIDDYVYGALRAGASGFLLKDTIPEELIAAIRTLAAGDALLAPSITRRLISEFAARRDTASLAGNDTLAELSAREREVLVEVARGLSNADIGETLHISAATAKTHVSRLLMKLSAHDRAQLVMIAYESGLVVPGTG